MHVNEVFLLDHMGNELLSAYYKQRKSCLKIKQAFGGTPQELSSIKQEIKDIELEMMRRIKVFQNSK